VRIIPSKFEAERVIITLKKLSRYDTEGARVAGEDGGVKVGCAYDRAIPAEVQ
jgi:hypothetical protein